MAPASTTLPDALWEAAKDPDIPDANDDMCWPVLKMFLKGKSVDVASFNEAECKKTFNRLRRDLNKAPGNDKGKGVERSPSTESQRKSETVSLSDSAYQSESPHDHGDQQPLQPYYVHALVERSTENPEGKIFVNGCFSDNTDEDYIIQTIYDRLNIPKGKDGKVSITYIPHKGETLCRSSFLVREDKEGQADMVFTRKRAAQKQKALKEHTDDHRSRDLSRSKEASERLQQHTEEPRERETMLSNTLARLFLEKEIQDLPDEGAVNLGRKVALALQGVNAVNET